MLMDIGPFIRQGVFTMVLGKLEYITANPVLHIILRLRWKAEIEWNLW